MDVIADILLVAAAIGATFYCFVLSRRLRRFTDLERGVGGAIAALSAQVDDMTRTLQSAQGAATASVSSLGTLTGRAETAAERLELLVASMHDLPDPGASGQGPTGAKTEEKAALPPKRPDHVEAAQPVSGSAGGVGEIEPVAMAEEELAALFTSRRAGNGGPA